MNGCHSKVRKDGYWVQDGYARDNDGRPVSPKYVWLDDIMTQTCQYDKRLQDNGCEGCLK